MRLRFLLPLVLSGSLALAQDARACKRPRWRNRPVSRPCRTLNWPQQAMQASQQEAQQRSRQQNSQSGVYGMPMAATPKLSVKPGTFSAPITLRMKDKTRGAVMYYTTDGWTPTRSQRAMLGRSTLLSTTHLQVIAIAPYFMRSQIATASYILPANRRLTPSRRRRNQFQSSARRKPRRKILCCRGKSGGSTGGDGERNLKKIGDWRLHPDGVGAGFGREWVWWLQKGNSCDGDCNTGGRRGNCWTAGHHHVCGAFALCPGKRDPAGRYGDEGRAEQIQDGSDGGNRAFVGISALFVHGKQAEIAPNMTLTALVTRTRRCSRQNRLLDRSHVVAGGASPWLDRDGVAGLLTLIGK